MGKYKSFANQGSFSEFQLNVPDQTQKIKNAAAKKIKGMDTAQQFLEKSQRVYQEAQELSQQRETETREANFQRQNQERENFKQALRRDTILKLEILRVNSAANKMNTRQLQSFHKLHLS